MYTQCPECGAAFRVTAQVLKQAAGKVRCGSCAQIFNALDYLSEEKPAPREPDIPELKPEPPASGAPDRGSVLMDTLNRLPRDEVVIEDTGVEWRVLDPDEDDGDTVPPATDRSLVDDPELTSAFFIGDSFGSDEPRLDSDHEHHDLFDDHGSTSVDESSVFDDASTNVDEVLELSPTPVDELLVPDSDGDDSHEFGPEEGTIVEEGDSEEIEISDDFDAGGDEDDDTPAAEADDGTREAGPQAAAEEELRFDDNTPLPESFLESLEPMAVAGEPEQEEEEPEERADESLNEQLDLGDPDEWQALLDDFGDLLATDLEAPAAEPTEAAADVAVVTSDDGDDRHDASGDAPTGELRLDEAPDPEAMRENELSLHEAAEVPTTAEDEPNDAAAPPAMPGEATESNEEPAPADEADSTGDSKESTADVGDADKEAWAGHDEPDETPAIADDAPEDQAPPAAAVDAVAASADDDTDNDEDEQLLVDDLLDLEVNDDSSDDIYTNEGLPELLDISDGSGNDDIEIPPETEEEQTINRLIDQDLLAIAHQDEDGFASTIVFEAERPAEDVSSIVIELGDDDDGEEHPPAVDGDTALAADSEEPPVDTVAGEEPGKGRRALMIAAAVLLVLTLAAQAIHFHREQLATSPAFAKFLLPLYDALGMPITPEWDVSSWRFESTREDFDEASETTTIHARVGNRSALDLPYPVLTVSVTDRYQEPIGSLVLEPSDYLGDTAGSTQRVAAGSRFDAAIPIASLSEAAFSYQLYACYRQPAGSLRCSTQDFR